MTTRFINYLSGPLTCLPGIDLDWDSGAFTFGYLNIGLLKLTQTAGPTLKGYKLEIWNRAARTGFPQYRSKDPKVGTLFDPTDRNGNASQEGWVLPYFDGDGSNKIHFRFHNYEASNVTFTVEAHIENPAAILSGMIFNNAVVFSGGVGSLSAPAVNGTCIMLYRNGIRQMLGGGGGDADFSVGLDLQTLTLTVPEATDGTDKFTVDFIPAP